ncbi:MAG: manganese efflux pump [Oscillospiraceae bacterium]|nr:manganese efflux pump [Oscillospiraceae bacterium]
MELILLGAATSADILAAALGISAAGIKFPFRSAVTAAFSGAAALWLSALLSSAANRILPLDGAIYISKVILFIMGLYAIFGDKIKERLHRRRKKGRRPLFNYAEVMNDPKISDCDDSKTISPAEGAAMGIALSADSLFMGISAGIAGLSPALIFVSSLLFGTAAVLAGTAIGTRLRAKSEKFGSFPVGGIILLILAVFI